MTLDASDASTPQLFGGVTNVGTINVDTSSNYTGGSSTLDNQGAIDIANGAQLSSNRTVFDDTGGTVMAAGSGQLVSSGFYEQGAGTTAGTQPYPVQIDGGSLQYTGGGASSLLVTAGITMSGNLSAGQSLYVNDAGGNTNVNANGGSFTNGGSITLDGSVGGVTFTIASGTMTNSGTFTMTGSTVNPNHAPPQLFGNVTNTGTINADDTADPNNYNWSNSVTLDNQGGIDIANGAQLYSRDTIIDDTGGTVMAAGSGQLVSSGFYEQGAGTTAGTQPYPVQIDGGSLQYTGGGASSLLVTAGITMSGNLSAGQSLYVNDAGGNTNVNANGGSFTNGGSITLDGSVGGVTFTIASGTMTNSGTFTMTGSTVNPNHAPPQLFGNVTNTVQLTPTTPPTRITTTGAIASRWTTRAGSISPTAHSCTPATRSSTTRAARSWRPVAASSSPAASTSRVPARRPARSPTRSRSMAAACSTPVEARARCWSRPGSR